MNIYEEVESRLKNAFGENVEFEFFDERCDGRHFSLVLISDLFIGKNRVERNRMIYTLFDDLFKNDVLHALRMKLQTPAEKNNF